MAIERGDTEAVLRLAKQHRLLHARGEFGESPLVASIANGQSALACELIQRGGSFEADGALAHAAMIGDLAVVNALICNGKNLDEPLQREGSSGYTPLMWATNRKNFLVMEALLAAGANINAIAANGTTAVMFTSAGEPDDLKALEILCRYKPDIRVKDWRGRDLVREAIDRERCSGKPEMRRLLEQYFPETDFNAT